MAANAKGNATKTERTSDRELVVTRTFNGPAHLVFKAWTTPALIMRWWAPKEFNVSFVSCETDVRVGGKVRFVMRHPSRPEPMAFFGRYLDVVPNARLVWTNEETSDGAVTTVTFEQKGQGKTAQTLVVVHELYPSKQALDEALASGSTEGWPAQYAQLDALLAE